MSGLKVKVSLFTYGIDLHAPLAGVRVLPQVVQQELPADVPEPGHSRNIIVFADLHALILRILVKKTYHLYS